MQAGAASRLSFNNSGDILLQTTSSGDANSTIRWNTVTVASNGDVGIGTTAAPAAKLEVAGNVKAQDATLSGSLNASSLSAQNAGIEDAIVKKLQINADDANTKAIAMKFNNKETFSVQGNGTLRTKELFTEKIEVKPNAWSDHVFYPEYELRSLPELEQYIKQNHRLPEIPSANEVQEKGIDLGEMQAKLLLKIEELTLYILQQNEQITILQSQINELKNRKP